MMGGTAPLSSLMMSPMNNNGQQEFMVPVTQEDGTQVMMPVSALSREQ